MSMTAVYALSAPLTAFICCAFISFMMKPLKLNDKLRMIIVYVVFLILCFAMEAGSQGITRIDFTAFNFTRFIFRVVAGLFVCIGMYLFYIRDVLSDKYERARKAKGKK